MFTTTIITPRGTNIGYNIINNLRTIANYPKLTVNNLVTTRDLVTKTNVTVLVYTPTK
jgi:hypothetical protein